MTCDGTVEYTVRALASPVFRIHLRASCSAAAKKRRYAGVSLAIAPGRCYMATIKLRRATETAVGVPPTLYRSSALGTCFVLAFMIYLMRAPRRVDPAETTRTFDHRRRRWGSYATSLSLRDRSRGRYADGLGWCR